jgi:hypothetical protein
VSVGKVMWNSKKIAYCMATAETEKMTLLRTLQEGSDDNEEKCSFGG